MSLQCQGCGNEFGFFRKQHGCNNCGLIFCYYCTTKSVVLPNNGSKKQKVCDKCYRQLTAGPTASSHSNSSHCGGTESVAESVSSSNDLNKPNTTHIPTRSVISTRNNPLDSEDGRSARNMATASYPASNIPPNIPLDPDERIRQRLQELRKDREPSSGMTDEAIGGRFEALTGRKAVSMQQSNDLLKPRPKKTEAEETSDLLHQMKDESALDGPSITDDVDAPTKERSEKEEVDDLIRQTAQECEIDKGTSEADEDIEARLAKLKDIDPSQFKTPVCTDFDSDDEREADARYLSGVLHEAFLDDKSEAMGYDPASLGNKSKSKNTKGKAKGKGGAADNIHDMPKSSIFNKEYEADSDEDELPWCCICNANGVLRCHGCDGDLYCKQCYREGHSREDYEDHEVSSFRPRKKGHR